MLHLDNYNLENKIFLLKICHKESVFYDTTYSERNTIASIIEIRTPSL
jgi:hypothetical protein